MPKLRLDSWKSIADYLERSPRTVQRWHAYHALPVHHFGGYKGSVFAYADEIDRWLLSIAQETRTVEFGDDDGLSMRRARSLELTARARELWESRSEESLHTIAGLYRKAIDQNPANATALTGLANTMISAALQGVMDSAIAFPAATEALRRTAQLDPDDVEAKCSAAWLDMVHERKWRQAMAGFEEVLNVQPCPAFALAGMALLHIAEGDISTGGDWAWKAWQQNSLVCVLGALVCWSQYLAGEFESALQMAAQIRMSGGCGVTLGAIEALALLQADLGPAQLKQIAAIAGDFPQSVLLQGILGCAYAASGNPAMAEEILDSLEQVNPQKKKCGAYGMALISMGVGSGRDAIRWLETAFEEGALWSLGFRSDPMLLPLRSDPRFQVLLRKIGTPVGHGSTGVHLELISKAV